MTCPLPISTRPVEPTLDDRVSFGSSQSPTMYGNRLYLPESPISGDNRRLGSPVSTTGSLWSTSARRSPSRVSRASFLTRLMESSPDQVLQNNMSSRMLPPCPELASSWEANLSYDQERQTGMLYGNARNQEISNQSRLMYVFKVILAYDVLERILPNLLLWNEVVMSTGALPVLENLGVLGMRRVSLLILRVPVPNFGMAIRVKHMVILINQLSSMNLEEKLGLDTYCDGLIGTQFWWRSKDLQSYCLAPTSGLLPICHLPSGIQAWILQLSTLSSED